MALNFDPSADFAAAADGAEAVTLQRRGSAPGSPGTDVAHALRRAVTTREAAESNGYYTASDVTWHLPTEELGDAPELGDVITDGDGRHWTVLEVQLATLRTRWRCATRSLAIVYALDDTITVLKATYVKDDGGAAEPTWWPWKTGVRARIQPQAAKADSEHQARQTTARYRIFVEEDLAVDHTHRIEGPDGAIYKITGVTGAERIGELQTIEAEVTPWPSS